MSEYTFTAQFGEYIPLYRGITETWVGTGDGSNPGNPEDTSHNEPGILYAKYINDDVQTIGSITDYALAAEAGFQGSFADWVDFLTETSDHVVNAEKWATGNVNASPSDEFVPGNSAKEQADRAAMWAAGTTTGTGTATDNAKYWAQQAASSATSASEDAEYAASRATFANTAATQANVAASNAHTSENNALSYKNTANTAKTDAVSAKTAAQTAQTAAETASTTAVSAKNDAVSAKTAAQTAQTAAETARTAAETAKNAAASWATGGTTGTPSATNNAKYYAEYAGSLVSGVQSYLSSATTVYANSTTATVPSSGWSDSATPVQGQYTWSKTTFTWSNGSTPTVVYNVSYVGSDSLSVEAITNNEIDALFT